MTFFNWLNLRPAAAVSDRNGSLNREGGADHSTLVALPPGRKARVAGFGPGLSPEHRAHLQAYGVIPGHEVQTLQHSPVTVAQVEHTELAVEAGVARQIWLELL
jgi:hypothetical protein